MADFGHGSQKNIGTKYGQLSRKQQSPLFVIRALIIEKLARSSSQALLTQDSCCTFKYY